MYEGASWTEAVTIHWNSEEFTQINNHTGK